MSIESVINSILFAFSNQIPIVKLWLFEDEQVVTTDAIIMAILIIVLEVCAISFVIVYAYRRLSKKDTPKSDLLDN